VAAEGDDATARPSDVAEQELQHAERADVLHAVGVLGEVQRVRDGPGLLRAGGAAVELRHLLELRRGMPHTFSTISRV